MPTQISYNNLARQYPNIRDQILDVTDQIMRSGIFMDGEHTRQFETWLARRNHVKHAVTCHSGTQALELMAEYLRSNYPKDEPPLVAIPALTYAATANAFARADWRIVFVDVDRYGVIDAARIPSDVDLAVTVGLFGAVVPDLIQDRRIMSVEDAAQNWIGNDFRRRGHASSISFDPVKNLANYGNAGAVVTDDGNFMAWMRSFRNNGKGGPTCAGTNTRISEIDAAQLMIKSRYLDQWQQRRGAIADHYINRLTSRVRCLIDGSNRKTHALQKFVIEVDNRDQLQKRLADRGIETRVHYCSMLNELPVFREWLGPNQSSQAFQLSRRVISLPLYPELTDTEVDLIAGEVLNCV